MARFVVAFINRWGEKDIVSCFGGSYEGCKEIIAYRKQFGDDLVASVGEVMSEARATEQGYRYRPALSDEASRGN
jgi:hypothetical protein